MGRTAESYFPLDVAFQASCGSNLLFRVEIQEYEHTHTFTAQQQKESSGSGQSTRASRPGDENDLKPLFSHILANDERNFFLFTYDTASSSSFKHHLKKAIKDLIFAHEEVQESLSSDKKAASSQSAFTSENLPARNNQMVPFMIMGVKKGKPAKVTS